MNSNLNIILETKFHFDHLLVKEMNSLQPSSSNPTFSEIQGYYEIITDQSKSSLRLDLSRYPLVFRPNPLLSINVVIN